MGFLGDVFKGSGGAIISGALGAVGGAMDAHNARAAARMNYEAQKEFAQNGIRWKVEDAKRAGIHPLAALGSMTTSYTPSSFVGSNMQESLSEMGQGINRAIEAKMTEGERMEEKARTLEAWNLDKENKQLQNEELRARIANIQADTVSLQAKASANRIASQQLPPSMPSVMPFYPTGETVSEESSVPTSERGYPGIQAGNPPDVRFYITSDGSRVPLPTEGAADAMDSAFLSGFNWFVRNNVVPTLNSYFGFPSDPNCPKGYYFNPFLGAYVRGRPSVDLLKLFKLFELSPLIYMFNK